ncbi:MAG: hypothetical protein ACOC2U_01230 [bacterium]
MKSPLLIAIIFFISFQQDDVLKYLNEEIKNIEIKGILISKKSVNSEYIFIVKDNATGEEKSIELKDEIHNSKNIYKFISPGDHFIKIAGELKVRLGHKVDNNIEVKHFQLLPKNE